MAVARQGITAGATRAVLTAYAAVPGLGLIGEPSGLQHLGLFIADGLGVVAARGFHGREGQHLGEVVLHHVPEGTRGFVVARALFHANGFCCRDLNVVDVIAVPDRLENGVRKAHHQDVLNRLFAEIVVDAEDLVFLPAAFDHAIEFLGTGVVAAKGFFNHHPAALGIGQEPGCRQSPATTAVEGWGDGKVEGAVAAGSALAVDLLEALAESHQVVAFLQINRLVEEASRKGFPALRVVSDLAGERRFHLLAEFVVAPGAASTAEHSKFARQPPLPEQIEQGWNQLAMREVAASAKDHQALR